MNKKVFTLLLLAVFVLAQVSIASAASISGTVTLEPLATFTTGANGHTYELNWSVTGMPGGNPQYLCFYYRTQNTPANPWMVYTSTNVFDLVNASGATTGPGTNFNDQDVVEFYAAVDNSGCPIPASSTSAMVSTFIDDEAPNGFEANPPYLDSDITFANNPVACNTFEMWALASDQWNNGTTWATEGYSGIADWNTSATGTFTPPAPLGSANELLSWVYTFPSTASGNWTFSVDPTDHVGNTYGVYYFRNALPIGASELENCADFTDTASHANEVYIRYLADLGLISGFADGTFGPDKTLTRAEAAALFEKANGWADDTGLPTSAPSAACTFTDVSASDWFSGWVWQACDDGFMNGVGSGLFDPNNLLTRGQIVTIFNNIVDSGSGATGSYLDPSPVYLTVLATAWGGWATGGQPELREIAWTDVNIGDYYAIPVVHAYGVGVADATGATTFSPNQAILRGEFAKMLYRALSSVDN